MKTLGMLVGLFVLLTTIVVADEADKALGYWKSISDVKGEEGKVTAVWKLSTNAEGQLEGQIVWVPGKPANEVYKSKKAEFNGKPVRGTKWMSGLKKSGPNCWGSGTIVDIGTAKGDVYGCEIKVVDNASKLEMRGYLGFSFLGRTQVWQAISAEEVANLKDN